MINYSVRKIKNPSNRTAAPKYYVTAKTLGYITKENLVSDMVQHTSLSDSEAQTALNYLTLSVPKFLKLGFTVKLGDMGHFRTTITSEGSENEQDAGKSKIQKLNVRFVAGKTMKLKLDETPLVKYQLPDPTAGTGSGTGTGA